MNLKGINIDSVIKLPLSKRIMILAVINIAVIGAAYWFLIGPKYDDVKRLKGQVRELDAKLNESRLIAADIPKFLHEKEVMEEKLKAAVAQLPNEKEIPDLIDSVSFAAEKSGLKILLFQPVREVKKGFYAEVPVNMSVEGRFESLYDFSAKVAGLPRIVNISGMNITSMGHKNRVPILKAGFVATTFRFVSNPTPEGAPKKK